MFNDDVQVIFLALKYDTEWPFEQLEEKQAMIILCRNHENIAQ